MARVLVLLFSVFVVLVPPALAENIVANPGFETGDLSDVIGRDGSEVLSDLCVAADRRAESAGMSPGSRMLVIVILKNSQSTGVRAGKKKSEVSSE